MDPEPDPIRSIAKGVVDSGIEWSEEKLDEFVYKLKNRDVIFIQDVETIDIAREVKESGEWDIYSKYVKDKELKILTQMGLTLRRLETNEEKLQELRERIFKTFGDYGLHISQFVQNEFLGKVIEFTFRKEIPKKEITKEIESLLRSIETFTMFIQKKDNPEKKARTILHRLEVLSPPTFLLCSIGGATRNVKKIMKILKNDLGDLGYSILVHSEKDIGAKKEKNLIFISKIIKNGIET